MKKHFYFFLFTFSFLLFTSPSKAQQAFDSSFRFYYYDQKLSIFEKSPVAKNAVAWIGDSITDLGEWSEFFPHLKTLNRGISSDNTFGVLNRLKEIVRHKPGKIFILIGINDIARGIPVEIIIRNYNRIADSLQLQLPAAKIYFQSILPTNNEFTDFVKYQNKTGQIIAVNTELNKMCIRRNITFINLYDEFTGADGKLNKLFTNDGLHLTGEGYMKWKRILTSNNYIK